MTVTVQHNPTVSAFEEVSIADYPGIFGDFDRDKIPNVDDPRPLHPGDTDTVEEVRLADEIKKLIELRKHYKKALNMVMRRLRSIDVASSVKGRVKTPYSVINKLRRKRIHSSIQTATAGETYTKGLTDMAGCMIILNNQADLNKVVDVIQSGNIGSILEHENFYAGPLNGYRAHHFVVLVEVQANKRDGKGRFTGSHQEPIPVEIQVKTKRMAAISATSHTAYKQDNLNGDEMLRLTDLAVKADQGDAAAKAELDSLLADKAKLQDALTIRQNRAKPSYEDQVAELQAGFTDMVAMYAQLLEKGKIPDGMVSKFNTALQNYGETLNMDFYQELEKVKEQPETEKPEPDRGKEPTGDIRTKDVDLRRFEPISLTRGQRKEINEQALAILEKQDSEITQADIKVLRKYTGAGGVGYASDAYKRGKMNEHYTSYPVIEMMWDKLQQMGVTGGNFLEPGSGIGNFAGFLPDRDNYRMVMVEKSPISSRIASLLFPRQTVLHRNFADTDLSRYNLSGAIGNVPFGNIKIYTRRDPLAQLKPNIHDYFILKSIDSVAPGSPIALITSTGTMDKKDSRIRKAITQRARFVGAYRLPSTAFKANAATTVTTDILIFQKYPETDQELHQDVSTPLNELFAYTALSESVQEYQGETYQAFYNPYFDKYPEHVLGEHIQGHDVQFLSRMGVKGELTKDTMEKVIGDGLTFPYPLPLAMDLFRADEGVYLDVPREYGSGSLVFHEGSFYEKQNNTFKAVTIPKGNTERVKSACLLLDTYADFVRALAQNSDNIESLRKEFKAKTQAHIEAFGIPDEDDVLRGEFQFDSRLYKLTTFVKRNPITGDLKYADIYDAESMYNKQYVPKLANSTDLNELAIFGHSIGAELDMDYYHSVYKGGTASREEIETALEKHENFFLNPETDRYEFRYEYLAGNVRKKLQLATEQGLEKNIKALQEVVPENISIYEIGLSPRHIFTYLPQEAISSWLEDVLGYDRVILGLFKDKAELGNRFYFKFRDRGTFTTTPSDQDTNLGWGNTPYSKIVLNYINDRNFDLHFYDEDGDHMPGMTLKRAKENGRTGLIERARKIQRENKNRMLSKIPKDFENWIRVNAEAELTEKIEEAYNATYNSEINPDFTGDTIRFRGMSNTFYGEKDFKIYKHNRAAAEKLIWNGRGANCHDVGAGKTMSAIITNETLLQQGAIKKPMFVVPGKVQEKWVEEYSMLFPDAKILNIKFADSQSRNKELAMAQLYNWDAIFISEHGFKRLPLSPKVQQQLLQERIEYFDEVIESFAEMIEADGAVTKSTKDSMIKRIEAQKEAYEQQVRDLSAIQREETDIYFDELGVDGLFVDEAHFYKNALGSAKATKLGIAANNPSQRAEDMLQKTKWLFSKIGHRNVFLLTATPVVNSPVEVWHMLQLCAPDMLKENQIDSLDNFINLFIQEEIKVVKKTTGEYAEKMVVSGYYNLPEMRRIIDQVMDIKSYDQLQAFYEQHPEYVTDGQGNKSQLKPSFVRPEAELHNEIVKPSRVHELLFEDIILRAEGILECMKDRDCETLDNFLVLTGDGSRIATDLRIYDGHFDGFSDESLKIQPLLAKVAESYSSVRENPDTGRFRPVPEDMYGNFFYGPEDTQPRENPPIRNQIIFCDFINTKDGNSFHQIVKQELVRQGIPAPEIAIINGSYIGTVGTSGKDRAVKSADDKEVLKKEVQDDFNAGKFRVIIGNKSIAEGMNLQRWTTDIHHLDVPYTPAEIQQRNGRGLRQGNNYKTVDIHYYLMADSFDQYRLELVNKKQGWIDQLFFGSKRQVEASDEAQSLNYEEMISATTSDPEIKQFFQSKAQLKTLTTKVSSLEAEKQRIEGSLVQAQKNVQDFIARVDEVTEKENAIKGMTIGHGYGDAGQLLDDNQVEVSRLSGFELAKLSATIQASLVESRYFSSMHVDVKLEVPKTNQNARLKLRIHPPQETSRAMYNRTSWKGLKLMAAKELRDALGWTDDELNTNAFTLLADQTDFEAHYGIDLAAEKAQDDEASWEDIKRGHGMFSYERWNPVFAKKIAQMILAFEKAWVNQAGSRLKLLAQGKQERSRKVSQLENELTSYTENLAQAQEDFDKHQSLVSKLIEKVKELTKTEFSSRSALYEQLNKIAPKFGVKESIPMKVIGEYTVSGEPRVRSKQQELEGLLRENREKPRKARFIFLGIVRKILIDQGKPDPVTLMGPHALLTNKAKNKIFVVPFSKLKELPEGIQDKKAEEVFKEWHNYAPDHKDFALQWPDDAKSSPVGWAHSIYYVSDKIMREWDGKGKMHVYHHRFDPGKRPAVKKGNILIVGNLELSGAGILN